MQKENQILKIAKQSAEEKIILAEEEVTLAKEEISLVQEQKKHLEKELKFLQFNYAQLRRMLFGAKRERYISKVVVNIGLSLRTDHGSQYDSNDFQKELKFLGVVYSPDFIRSPECNGIIERFHRTLVENVLNNQVFESLEQARKAIDVRGVYGPK